MEGNLFVSLSLHLLASGCVCECVCQCVCRVSRHVGGGALTLWALLAGAVERLHVEPLTFFAPGAWRGLSALPGPPHGAVGPASRPLAPLTPATVHCRETQWKK